MKVFFGGDFIPHDAHARAVTETRAYIASPQFAGADLRVVNLECLLVPPEARAPESAALGVRDTSCAALRRLDIGVVSLANNHLFDYGVAGANATMQHLRAAGIAFVGAGMDEAEAHRPFTFGDGWGLWGYCDAHPIYLRGVPFASPRTPGVAGLTLERVRRDLDAAASVRHAVLMVHWGREHSCIPLDTTVSLAVALLDHPKVRLIVGAHPHRLQGIRRTRHGTVAFSLGHLHMPGFVIAPPLVMSGFSRDSLPATRSFHEVRRPTFKVWPAPARLGAGLLLDTDTCATSIVPLWQPRNSLRVRELRGVPAMAVRSGMHAAGVLARLPGRWLQVWHRIGGTLAYLTYLRSLGRHNGLGAAMAAVTTLRQVRATRRAEPPRDARPTAGE